MINNLINYINYYKSNCPFRCFCVDEAKIVCVRARPGKQRVLSRSKSTGDILSLRGKESTSDFIRFC